MNTLLAHDRPHMHIDLGVLANNWRTVRRTFRGQRVGVVVKNDAYGLGISQVAPLLWNLGCRDFWVSHSTEALKLRGLLPEHSTRIMVLHGLGGIAPEDFAAHGLIPVLAGPHELHQLQGYGSKHGQAMPVAIHLDTGLTRLGFTGTDLHLLHGSRLQTDIKAMIWVSHLGRFSHPDAPECLHQRHTFAAWLQQLPPAERSITTSSSVFANPAWHCDHARVGSALFGVQTAAQYQQPLQNVTSLYAPVMRVADVPAYTEVGYAGQYRTSQNTRIATIAAGYGDGLPISLAPRGVLYLKGRPAPIVGGIAMGMLGLDISAFAPGEIQPGMWAEIYGLHQPLAQLAATAGITPNALLTCTGALALRRYMSPHSGQEPLV